MLYYELFWYKSSNIHLCVFFLPIWLHVFPNCNIWQVSMVRSEMLLLGSSRRGAFFKFVQVSFPCSSCSQGLKIHMARKSDPSCTFPPIILLLDHLSTVFVICTLIHWHRRSGRQLLLAKVRMPIGRIGIFCIEKKAMQNMLVHVIEFSSQQLVSQCIFVVYSLISEATWEYLPWRCQTCLWYTQTGCGIWVPYVCPAKTGLKVIHTWILTLLMLSGVFWDPRRM